MNTWTMRYEAKLSIIKRASCHGNFKNICLTIAKRHQHHLCYLLNANENFLGKDGYSSCNQSKEPEIELDLWQFIQQTNTLITTTSRVLQPKWIKHGSLHYQNGAFLFLENSTLFPKLAKMIDIYVLQSLKLQTYEITSCDCNYNAFIVEPLAS